MTLCFRKKNSWSIFTQIHAIRHTTLCPLSSWKAGLIILAFKCNIYARVTYMAFYLVGHGTTYFHNIADDIGAYLSSILSNLHNAWLSMPWLHVFCEISSLAHHNPHINAIFVYLLVQELFVDKIYFFMFLSMSDKPRLHQLKMITSTCETVQVSLAVWFFPSV